MSSDNSLISSSTDAENLNPIHATSSGEGAPLPDRRKSMEDLSKEQLITMFQKFRTQAGSYYRIVISTISKERI